MWARLLQDAVQPGAQDAVQPGVRDTIQPGGAQDARRYLASLVIGGKSRFHPESVLVRVTAGRCSAATAAGPV